MGGPSEAPLRTKRRSIAAISWSALLGIAGMGVDHRLFLSACCLVMLARLDVLVVCSGTLFGHYLGLYQRYREQHDRENYQRPSKTNKLVRLALQFRSQLFLFFGDMDECNNLNHQPVHLSGKFVGRVRRIFGDPNLKSSSCKLTLYNCVVFVFIRCQMKKLLNLSGRCLGKPLALLKMTTGQTRYLFRRLSHRVVVLPNSIIKRDNGNENDQNALRNPPEKPTDNNAIQSADSDAQIPLLSLLVVLECPIGRPYYLDDLARTIQHRHQLEESVHLWQSLARPVSEYWPELYVRCNRIRSSWSAIPNKKWAPCWTRCKASRDEGIRCFARRPSFFAAGRELPVEMSKPSG